MITGGLLVFSVLMATVFGSLMGMAALVLTGRRWVALFVAASWAVATTFVLVASGVV